MEKDLIKARREGRFEEALLCLDEIFVYHKYTEDNAVRARCAALLAAPETFQKVA